MTCNADQVTPSFLVIPSELDKSLAVFDGRTHWSLARVRNASTPLDITTHGHYTFDSSLSRRWADRLSLFIRRPCGCVGLHRYDGAVWSCTDGCSTDGACA